MGNKKRTIQKAPKPRTFITKLNDSILYSDTIAEREGERKEGGKERKVRG